MICPRSAILQRAAASIVEGNLGGHRLDRRKDRNPRHSGSERIEKIDGVLNDVALGLEIREDVDGGVGDEQYFGVRRDVHDEHVTDPPGRPQPGRAGGHGPHQLVGMQAAFHQELALALADQLDAPVGCRIALRRIDQREAADFDLVPTRGRSDFRRRSDEYRLDDADLGRFGRSSQRCLVTGMNHDGPGRGDLFGAGDELFVLRVRPTTDRTDLRRINDGADLVMELFRYDALAATTEDTVGGATSLGSARPTSVSNSWARCARRAAASPVISPGALSTFVIALNALRRRSASGGSSAGIAASAAS